MRISLLFRMTGTLVGLQLAVGGLVTFGYIGAGAHTLLGVIVGILALVTLVYSIRMKPRARPLVGLSTGIGVDVLLQAVLGFGVLGTSSNGALSTALAYVHFLNALAIFAMALMGNLIAMRMDGIGPSAPSAPAAKTEQA